MLRSQSHVVKMERCPACAKIGNDRSGDNLAVYSDGHSYCFSCGYTVRNGNVFNRISVEKTIQQKTEVILPYDVTTELPYEALNWLKQYDLTSLDIKQNLCMWSESQSRLIFPYFGEGGNLLAWQGRHIPTEHKKEGKKWFSQGDIHDIVHIIKPDKTKPLVLVEDIVSAIKVGHHNPCMPIFGSVLSKTMILSLKFMVDGITLWLDPDKRTESVKMAFLSTNLGLPCGIIFSDKDPKELSHEELQKKLTRT